MIKAIRSMPSIQQPACRAKSCVFRGPRGRTFTRDRAAAPRHHTTRDHSRCMLPGRVEERFLLVGGDQETRSAVEQCLAKHGGTRLSKTVVEARQLLAESWHWDGLLLCVAESPDEALEMLE